MGKTLKYGSHDYPSDFGFTGSAGKSVVRQHVRGPRQQRPAPPELPLAPAPAPQRPKG